MIAISTVTAIVVTLIGAFIGSFPLLLIRVKHFSRSHFVLGTIVSIAGISITASYFTPIDSQLPLALTFVYLFPVGAFASSIKKVMQRGSPTNRTTEIDSEN